MMLEVSGLNTYYGNIHALQDFSLNIEKGEIVTLLGSNGAGKTTLLSTITGIVRPKSGSILFEGKEIAGAAPSEIVRMGVSMAPEGREVFPQLTVIQNLQMGAYSNKNPKDVADAYEQVFELFPRLAERKKQLAGTLSGGEQQMLAIGRALMSTPKLLLLDEPSLGLAPNLVAIIFKLILHINKMGTTIILVEQNANMALKIAHRGYVMQNGKIELSGTAKELISNEEVKKAYLGV